MAADSRLERVLFCCTGNVFRSMTAEYALRRELARRGEPVVVSSAGIEDLPQMVRPYVRSYLAGHGLDVSAHARRTLTRDMLSSAELVVAMSGDHRDFIWSRFQTRTPLFLELCTADRTELPDVDEAVPDYLTNREAAEAHMRLTIDTIIDLTPRIAEHVCNLRRG